MEYDYEKLLGNVRSEIPQVVSKQKRLEIPELHASIAGTRTIFHNFKQVSEAMNRDPQHLLKFMSGEMATAGTYQEPRVVFNGKFPRRTLETLVQRYIDHYVICPVCNLPDTKIVKEDRLYFLVCEACGAKSSIREL
ncbi:MAG: translation initiation factor IF-2 subunit beta [Thermoproteota archaeon]